MSIDIAIVVLGVLILVGLIIAGGEIYSAISKLADAINKQK